MQWQFILLGLLVGLLIGLTGAGGGSLMTPLLVLTLGIQPIVAIGVDLAYTSVTKAVAAIVHLRQGQVRVDVALWLMAGSVPSSVIGVIALRHLAGGNPAAANAFVSHALGMALLLVAVVLVTLPIAQRRLWPENPPPLLSDRLQALRRIRPALLVVVGVVVGLVVGLTSVGGGSLVMVALVLLFPRWSMARRVGVDVFQGCALAAVAAATQWRLGMVDLAVVGQLLIGSIPGAFIGARLSGVAPERALRPLVAGMLALSAWKLL